MQPRTYPTLLYPSKKVVSYSVLWEDKTKGRVTHKQPPAGGLLSGTGEQKYSDDYSTSGYLYQCRIRIFTDIKQSQY